jgi:hypothetical protein
MSDQNFTTPRPRWGDPEHPTPAPPILPPKNKDELDQDAADEVPNP